MKTHPTAFRGQESSETTKPCYLYVIDYSGTLYHLTNYDGDLSIEGIPAGKGSDPQVFNAANMNHSAIQQKSELSAARVSVSIGINSSPFADVLRQFVLTTPPDKIQITIARVNSSTLAAGGTVNWADDVYVTFKGVVMNVAFSRSTIQLAMVSLLLQNDGKVPRYFYQKTCQHALYGANGCGIDYDQNAFRINTTVDAVDARKRYVDIAETQLDGEDITGTMFQGGFFVLLDGPGGTETNRISILNAEDIPGGGTRFFLLWWDYTLAATLNVQVVRGCRRTITDCSSVFNNVSNFGGMPYIPDVNPTVNGIQS